MARVGHEIEVELRENISGEERFHSVGDGRQPALDDVAHGGDGDQASEELVERERLEGWYGEYCGRKGNGYGAGD